MFKNFLIPLTIGLLVSCSAENDEIYNNLSESIIKTESGMEQNTDSIDEVEIFNGDNELIERMNMLRNQPLGRSRALLGPSDVDPLLAENLYALQGLPFNLIVKGVATGANPTHNCLSSNKSNREATLNTQLKGATWEYYIKINRGFVEDWYNIYGVSTNTPLVVASYSNNRDEKILYLNKEDTPTAPAANWYILPSSTQGYFNIASYSHIGEASNRRVFNYMLEAQPKDKIRYAELVKNKPQQLFKIQFLDSFDIKTVNYDIDNAIVTSLAPHTETYRILHSPNNTESKPTLFPIRKNDTSVFYEDSGLKIELKKSSLTFPRPKVYAENKATIDVTLKDAIYQNEIQEIALNAYSNELVLKPHSYAEVKITYRMFELRIPYTMEATITYKDLSNSNIEKKATVKITGTWVGHSHGDFSIYPPTMLPPRYFDIETGEELFY